MIATHDLVIAALIGLVVARRRHCDHARRGLVRGFVRPVEAAGLDLRTAFGGLLVGLLAMIAPQVMSSGHGALRFSGMFQLSLATVALLFVLKIIASVISLGSGFRGGLFFASLFIGALGGNFAGHRAHHDLAERRFRFERLCGDRHERRCRPR